MLANTNKMAFKHQFTLGWQLHVLSLILLLALVLGSWFTFPRQTSAVILHYSVGVGIDFIGEGNQIRTLGLIGGIFFLTNLILGHGIYASNRAAAWILWGINPIVQAFLLIAYLLLWQLNR